MTSAFARFVFLSASVTPALAFCGSHTHVDRRLGRRQAGGEETVEVNDFGYTGLQVSLECPSVWLSVTRAYAIIILTVGI